MGKISAADWAWIFAISELARLNVSNFQLVILDKFLYFHGSIFYAHEILQKYYALKMHVMYSHEIFHKKMH